MDNTFRLMLGGVLFGFFLPILPTFIFSAQVDTILCIIGLLLVVRGWKGFIKEDER